MAKNNPINYSDFFNDDGAIDKLIKKLKEVDAVYNKLSKDVAKSFEDMSQKASEYDTSTEDGRKQIEKLEKELEKLIKANKELKEGEEQLIDQKKRALKLTKDEAKLLKKKNELTDEQTLKNAELKEEIREQNKVLKQQARENKGLVGEYEKQSKTLIKLRKEYKNLAVAGKENTDEAKKLLLQVTELDAKLKRVDKTVGQTQREVGNYKEAISEAVAENQAFAEGLTGAIDQSGKLGEITGKLSGLISILTSVKDKLTAETNKNTVAEAKNVKVGKAQENQQKKTRIATLLSTKAFKVFNAVLKASIIGVIVLALGSLIATLTRTQKGLNTLKAISLSASAIIGELSKRLIALGPAFISLGKVVTLPLQLAYKGVIALVDGFKLLGLAIENLGALGLNKKIKEDYEKAKEESKKSGAELLSTLTSVPDNLQKAFEGFTVFDGLLDKLKEIKDKALPLAEKLNNLELTNAEESLKLETLIGKLAELEAIEGDNTRSLQERNKAIIEGAKVQQQIADKEVESAKRRLEIFNLEAQFGRQGIKQTSEQRIAQIELEKEVVRTQQEALEKKVAVNTLKSQIDQDYSELELDVLIDGFDKRKTLNEKIIDDEKVVFQERIELLNKTRKLGNESAEAQIEILNKTAKEEINLSKLVAEQDARKLKEQILGYELSEILTTRLFEVVRERQQVLADLDEKEKELNEQRLESLKATIKAEEDLTIAVIENENERALKQEQIRFDRELAELNSRIKIAKGDIELTEKLLNEKLALEKEFQEKKDEIAINSLEELNKEIATKQEIELLKNGAKQEEINEKLRDQRITALEKEIELRKELEEDYLDKELELARLKATKEVEIEKNKQKQIKEVRDLAVTTSLDIFKDNLDKELNLLSKKSAETENQLSRQQELAKEGLANTLAFEEGELAKLESKKIEAQKKQIRLEKIRALYSGYTANTNAGDTSSEALTKALRDYGIVTGLELALSKAGTGTGAGNFDDFFKGGENGSKNGNSLSNGIFKGDSHKAKSGGIPILVERNEALMDAPRMNKFGQHNWNKLINGIDSGSIGSDFMTEQVRAIPVAGGLSVNFKGLENSINDVKKTIENKPVQEVNIEQMSDLYADFVEKKTIGNKVQVSRFRVRKKRF